ncbi:MAG: hypothetical protein QOC56_1067 [Alphaproteobacteria bacterium]|nr:hypothetical protein [Alphaproteobacteria bacterium]
MTLRSLAGVVVTGAHLATAAPALGASGITPLSPKSGATVAAGESPTFKMRVKGAGQVWVHVCKSKKKNADGVICSDESIGRAKKKGSAFQYKPKFFDFDEFWLNSPGTYYWQAHRIQCEGNIDDCLQEGAIVKFKVG